MSEIISVTSNAIDQIKKLLSQAPKDIDSLLVGIDKTGCSGYSYKLDFAKSSDYEDFEKIVQEGTKILIDPKATLFLIGSTMDYKTDKLSSRFVFNNPNEKNTCGCGESFSI